jgi:hypothetical protein
MLYNYYLLVVKLLLHAPLAPKFEGVLVSLNLNAFSAISSLYSLSLISQIYLLLFHALYLSSLISQIYLLLFHALYLSSLISHLSNLSSSPSFFELGSDPVFLIYQDLPF